MSVRALLFSTLFVFFVAFAPLVMAAEGGLSIAVVDVEKILVESKAAQSVKKQIDEKRNDFLSDVEKTEKGLRDQQQEIQKAASALPKEELSTNKDLAEKAKKFDEKRAAEKGRLQTKKEKLDEAYSVAMGKLTKAIYDVCQTIADERKFDLVITRQNIIVGNKSLDITADVLTQLDQKLPTLALDGKK